MSITRLPGLPDLLSGTPARGDVPRYNGTRFVSRPSSYIDVRDFGAVPDGDGAGGGTDSTAAIQAAINAGTGAEPIFFAGESLSRRRYNITDTITCLTGTRIQGERGSMGQAYPELDWYGTASKDAIVSNGSTTPGGFSRFAIEGVALYNRNGVSGASQTGRGIVVDNVFNGVSVRDVLVSGFRDNLFIGSATPGKVSDCIDVTNVWAINPQRYGIYLLRCNNTTRLSSIFGDTTTAEAATAQALIAIGGTNQGHAFSIQNVKHENQVSTCDTILIDNVDLTILISGVTMRQGAGRDVVRHTGTGAGMVLVGITSDNTAFSDAQTTPTNLLNITGGTNPITIPASDRQIALWVGGTTPNAGSKGNRLLVGAASLFSGKGAPESVVTANPGALYLRTDGAAGTSLYVKQSGTSTTGWGAVPTKLTGSKTFDWPSIAAGATSSTTVTVTGAALGDTAVASMSVDVQGMEITAHVSAADTVTVVLRNGTGAPIDLASGTLKAVVTKA